jgi:hypothetical protein
LDPSITLSSPPLENSSQPHQAATAQFGFGGLKVASSSGSFTFVTAMESHFQPMVID